MTDEEKKPYELTIQASDYLDQMRSTEGWKLLEARWNKELDNQMNRVLTCNKEDIYAIRETAKTLKMLLALPDRMRQEGVLARQQLEAADSSTGR